MKHRILALLAAIMVFVALPSIAQPTYVAQSGVSLFTAVTATATHTSTAVRLPTFSGVGNISITGVGITGSPSGCTIALAYEQNNATSATAAVATISFTPAVSVQQAVVSPTTTTGDNYVATYACSSTYPTAGTLYVSFSPSLTSAVASGAVSITGYPTMNLAQVGGVALGATANYGSSPGAVKVQGVNAYITNTPTVAFAVTGDPCQNPNVAKSSVAVAISTATTTQLVAPSGTTAVYGCGFAATFGASTTALFEYGTSSNCTGTTALTGVMAPATGGVLSLGSARFQTPASQGVCIVSTGTGGINGIFSYAQF